MLFLDPTKRLDADNALNLDFFWTDPMPISLDRMLSNHGQSLFDYLAPARRGGREGDAAPANAAAQRGVHGQGVLGRGGGDNHMFYIFVFTEGG